MLFLLPTKEIYFAFKCFQHYHREHRVVYSLRKRLSKTFSQFLSAEDTIRVSNSYDIVGDIAILRWKRKASPKSERRIAEAIMFIHRNVKTK
jgi:tRNA G37 N-methylase Trm5